MNIFRQHDASIPTSNQSEPRIIRLLQRDILLSIKELCINESYTLADIVILIKLQREILIAIKGLCMKRSSTLEDNVIISQLQREILLA